MDHASLDPRSSGSNDSKTVPYKSPAGQAARAAYIARVVAEAPPLTDAQIDHIAVLLRPRAQQSNATPTISVSDWVKWENKRYIEATETPGIHGTYGNEVAA